MNEIRRKLLAAFQLEYREHLEGMRQPLQCADPARAGLDLVELNRRAHSLKGAARAVDFGEVEKLAHDLETLFQKAQRGEVELDREITGVIQVVLDAIEDWVSGWDETREPERPAGARKALAAVLDGRTPALADAAACATTSPPAEQAPPRPAARAPSQQSASATSAIRVNADNLDQLLESAGELQNDLILQRKLAQDARRIFETAAALERRWSRLAWQLTPLLKQAHDGWSSSRLAESVADVAAQIEALAQGSKTASRTQDRCLWSLRQHLAQLQDHVKAARVVPVESVFGGFRKVIRDVAQREGKQVDVVLEGLENLADRMVLQRIKDPVMHLVRNAVSHGIEPPQERLANGKVARGRVGCEISSAHDRLVIKVADDGRGLDYARIAVVARERGLLAAEVEASPETLGRLIFEPGFSTASAVTEISGRGIGMSIVRQAVDDLQGALEVRPANGGGTEFSISLPVTIAVQRVLIFEVADQVFAVPSRSVAGLHRVAATGLATLHGRPALRMEDEMIPLAYAGELLGTPKSPRERERDCTKLTVMVLETLPRRLAVGVDRLRSVDEHVIKRVELKTDRWIGAISLEDGAPCLVMNPVATLNAFFASEPEAAITPLGDAEPQDPPDILVVDDSITTRTLEKSILEAHGYRVRLAVDGTDALGQLRARPADLVVSDIEMPRMNGLELVRSIRDDRVLTKTPVILVTSRNSDADRRRGLEFGADAYIVKQRFDHQGLLQTVRQLI